VGETVTGVTPGRARLCVALLVLMGFALGCLEFIVIGIESDLAEEPGVSLTTAGQLISLFALPYAVMTPVLALVTGRFRRYSVMLVYLVIFCVGNTLSAFAPGFGVLLATRMLLGSVLGALLAVGVTFTPEPVGTKKSSGALTLGSSLEPLSFNVGIAFGTFAGGLVVSGPGIRAVGLVGAVLAVAAAALADVTLMLSRREESLG